MSVVYLMNHEMEGSTVSLRRTPADVFTAINNTKRPFNPSIDIITTSVKACFEDDKMQISRTTAKLKQKET